MRYGYAVLNEEEDDYESGKLFFDHILFIDRMFTDRGNDRSQMQELIDLVGYGDQVVMQSVSECGLSESEIVTFRSSLREKCTRLSFFEYVPDICNYPFDKDETVDTKFEEKAVSVLGEHTDVVGKSHRGRKKKDLMSDEFLELVEELNKGLITKKEMAERLGVCYATLQKNLDIYREQEL